MSVNPNDLRALADFLDEHPDLAEAAVSPCVFVFTYNTDAWDRHRRALGTYEKGTDGYDLEATRKFGDARIKVCISKERTCERVQVSEREVEREVYPDDVVPAIVKVIEPVYEWRCPESWVAPQLEAAS